MNDFDEMARIAREHRAYMGTAIDAPKVGADDDDGPPPLPPIEAYAEDFSSGAGKVPSPPSGSGARVIVPKPERKSRFRCASELEGKDVPPRQWLVDDLIPQRVVTSLYGDGGTGKSLLALQLAVAVATGRRWLGRPTISGSVVFLTAEDDEDELHRRLAAIVAQQQVGFSDLDRLIFRSLAGEDALLAVADGGRSGVIVPSDLHDEVDKVLSEEKPALLVLDTLADLFPGNENDRAQVTQFVGILIGLAIRHNCAVLLLAHPSRSGMSSGGGDGGSTAWNGKVRSRLYLERVLIDGEEPDTNARKLTNKKANLGPTGIEISMKWQDGAFVPEAQEAELDRMAKNARAERVFLKLLRLFNTQGRRVNHAGAASYAPKLFSEHPDCEGMTKRVLKAAMESMLADGRLVILSEGPPSRRVSYIALADP